MKKPFVYFFMFFIFAACNNEQESNAEDVAIGFFDAIYNQKDITKATAYCSPNFAAKVQKYQTANHLAQRLFNRSYDTVKIDTGMGDTSVRREFRTTGELTILFTGKFDGKIIKELKKIKLIKYQSKWYVDKILKDPVPH